MNGSGSLFTDAGLACFYLYVFYGAWIATVVGLGLAVGVMWRPGRRRLGAGLALGCLAPFAYTMLWALLASRAPELSPETSDPWIYGVVAGLAVSVLAGPIAALVCLARGPKRQIAPS